MTAVAPPPTAADLLREAGPYLFAKSFRHAAALGLDADDVISLALHKLGRLAHTFDPTRGKATTFLGLVVRSAGSQLSRMRRCRVGHAAVIEDYPIGGDHGEKGTAVSLAPGDAPDPLAEAIRREDAGRVRRALRRLPPREREVIRRRYGFGNRSPEDQKAIAADFGTTHQAVSLIERRALARLAAHLARH